MNKMSFCPQCGKPLVQVVRDGKDRMVCVDAQDCGYVFWNNPTPVVGAIVEHEGEVLLARNAAWPEGWEKTVGQFLLGQIPEDRFLAEAKATAGRSPLLRASESNYFAAVKRLIEGDAAGARPLLEQSVAAQQPLRFTHTLAQGELARLAP